MRLDKILEKIYHVEGLVIALETMLFDHIEVTHECYEEFNAVTTLIHLLRFKTKEIRTDISKHI